MRAACSRDGLPRAGTVQVALSGRLLDSGSVERLCALQRDTSVWCWSAEADPSTAARVALPPAQGLAASFDETCALLVDGAVRCWDVSGASRAPQVVEGVAGVTALEGNAGRWICARSSGGTTCWENRLGARRLVPIAEATGVEAFSLGPARGYLKLGVSPRTLLTARVQGQGGTRCVTVGGEPRCWGPNRSGEVGDGTREPRGAPVLVTFADGARPRGVVEYALGLDLSYALLRDGTVVGWGGSWRAPHARRVPGLVGVVQLVAGYNHWCARDAAGHVRCWGLSESGTLGVSTREKWVLEEHAVEVLR